MQHLDGQLILSATDLVDFAACGHRTSLNREVALGLRPKPTRDDPMGRLLGRMGDAHEADELEAATTPGTTVVTIAPPGPGTKGLADAEQQTRQAMEAGADVVYQATFFDPPWRGHADFLFRVDTPSNLGHWSYEVGDAKLHRKPKERDWLQLAFYTDQLARLQGHTPDQAHILLDDDANTRATGPIAEHLIKIRRLQAELRNAIDTEADPHPEPNDSCTFCRWQPDCTERWRAEGHLSLVSIDRRVRPKLEAAGITTVTDLADLGPAASVDGIQPERLRKFRSDARLYLHEQRTGIAHLRLRYPRDNEGLALLPAPADGDVFFDLEGFPFGPDRQLEYLWGVVVRAGGTDSYRRWWAHNPEDEEVAFGATVTFLESAVAADADRRVYHYNSYEPAVFRRLAARVGGDVGVRALALVDAVFVDLLPIARTSVRTSSMSAGLKALERFYRADRQGNVTDAAASMVDYAAWIDRGDPTLLQSIEDYNRDDCVSLADMRDWLLGLAADVADARSGGPTDPEVEEAALIPDLRARLVAAADLAGGDLLLRRTLVALDYEEDFDAGELGALLGRPREAVVAQLIKGKKELGIPLSVDELNAGATS